MTPNPPSQDAPRLSIVAPALNEQDNLGPLVDEVESAMHAAGLTFELIIVDDGSTDATCDRLAALRAGRPWLHALRLPRTQGQSAAMGAGVAAARGSYIATLDADLQNDPASLPPLLDRLVQADVDMVQGDRSASRQDSRARRLASGVGRVMRRAVIGDPVRDTGCSARVLRASFAKRLPLQFKGMHRFVPAMVRMNGGRVIEVPVGHRARRSGVTKYGVGVISRGVSGLVDLLAVRWMRKRLRSLDAEPIAAAPTPAESAPEPVVPAESGP